MPKNESTIQEIYQNILNTLSSGDLKEICFAVREAVAASILNDLTQSNVAVIDTSNTWIEQDLSEVTNFSLQYAANLFPIQRTS